MWVCELWRATHTPTHPPGPIDAFVLKRLRAAGLRPNPRASKTALIRFTECLALETRSHGIAVFSMSPGTVRTAMSEYSLHSPEGQKWLPWFRRLFDENVVVPAERPANLVLELASGRADALSGRFLSIYDDLDHLLKNSAQIEQKNLHALKVEKLPSAQPNPMLASILAEARNAAK